MKNRSLSLDLLKVILSILVIFIHSRFFIEYNLGISYLTTEGLFRMAVPIFFIINGFYFKYILDNKKIKKWVIRSLILYTVWMLIYAPLWFYGGIKSIVTSVLIGYHHLWYINSMLFSGILLYLTKKINYKYLIILSFFLFLFGVIFQYLENFHILNKLIYRHRNFLFLGFPFFTIGYLIHKKSWLNKISKKQTFILIFLSAILLVIESYVNYHYAEERIDNLFTLIIICPLIFIFVMGLKIDYSKNSKYLALISTSIYLIHPWVMTFLNFLFKFKPSLLSILTILISILISIFVIKLNDKIKILL